MQSFQSQKKNVSSNFDAFQLNYAIIDFLSFHLFLVVRKKEPSLNGHTIKSFRSCKILLQFFH